MARRAAKPRPTSPKDGGRIAVIDIGSNSIRLVVYDRLCRAPIPLFNEKVLCGLGRDLARTGRLNPEGVRLALDHLARFALLAEAMEVPPAGTHVLATAAVRDAADGADFAERVRRRSGLPVAIISGTAEARLSALGVLAGSPGADGVVGDLGGGSLELVGLDHGRLAEQTTLPLGPFRLMDESDGRSRARQIVAEQLGRETWLAAYKGRDFHPVGGSWRALARILMSAKKHPLHVIQQFTASTADVMQMAELVATQHKASLERMLDVSRRRLETLPYAALTLAGVLQALKPSRVVFSAYGLREGHLFDLLTPQQQAEDPLLHAAAAIATKLDRFGHAELVDGWTEGLLPNEDDWLARLRHAACLLCDIAWPEHPDYRHEHAFLRVLRLPVPGLEHDERVFLALALHARYGGQQDDPLIQPVLGLLSAERNGQALLLGLVLRLANSLAGGVSTLLSRTQLKRRRGDLILVLPEELTDLAGESVLRRLEAVAKALKATARLEIGGRRTAVGAEPSCRAARQRSALAERAAASRPTIGWSRPCGLDLPANCRDGIRQARRHGDETRDQGVALKAQISRQLSPLQPADIVKAILAAYLHGELDAPGLHRGVACHAGNIVERRQAHLSSAADQDTVVLGVRVGACGQPAIGEGIDESRDVFGARPGIGTKQVDDVARTWPTFVLVLPRWRHAQRLAHVFLMDAANAGCLADAVVALDDDRGLAAEAEESRTRRRQAEFACERQAKVLVLDQAIEKTRRRLEDMRRRHSA